jgi:hypothetical protein
MIEWLYRRAYWDGKRGCRVIRVKSWRPFWGPYGLEWPVLLVDSPHRMTATPVWDWMLIRCLLFGRPKVGVLGPPDDTTGMW